MASKEGDKIPESLPKDMKHPFYPWDLKIPHYVENRMDRATLLLIFGACALFVFVAAWVITGRRTQTFCFSRRLVLCWFMLCAFIHTIFEGYFAVYHASIAGHSSIMGELWKEYAKGDSRYMISDPLMVCAETLTAVIEGPLCFLTFLAFMKSSGYRYSIQMILSLFQLYANSLYVYTEFKDDFIHTPYGHPIYFGLYFVFLKSLSICVPIALIIDSFQHMTHCQHVCDFYIDEYNEKVNAKSKKDN